MKANYCPECGAKLLKGAAFCIACGTPIIQEEEIVEIPVKHCSSCDYSTVEDEKFCPKCGSQMTNTFDEVSISDDIPLQTNAEEGKGFSGPSKKNENNPKIESERKTITRSQTRNEEPKQQKKGCFARFIKWILILALLVIGLAVLLIVLEDADIFKESSSYTQETSDLIDAYEKNKDALKENDIYSADKYRYGIDVIPDQYEAFERYKVLAEKGDLNAMISLSEYYEQGIWVKKNRKKARELLEKAAEEGSIEAQWQLEFLNGNGR